MSDLPPLFDHFRAARREVFELSAVGTLAFALDCPLAIVESKGNKLIVEIAGEDEEVEAFSVTQRGHLVTLRRGLCLMDRMRAFLSGFARSPSTVCASNGVILCTDETADVKDKTLRPMAPQQTQIIVQAPAMTNLDGSLCGSGLLFSTLMHGLVRLDLSNQASAGVAGHQMFVEMTDQADLQAYCRDAPFSLRARKQSMAKVHGAFTSLALHTSEMAEIETLGPVRDVFKVRATGSSRIHHRGSTGRTFLKWSSDAARITIG